MVPTDEVFNNYSIVEALSHTSLQVQQPAYICCIFLCAIDAASCILFLILTKYPYEIGANFYIICDIIWEMLSSIAYAVSSSVHLYNSSLGFSEVTTRWKCFVTFGWISYFTILASDYSSAMISIDRFICLVLPLVYKKFEPKHHAILGTVICFLITIFVCSLLFDEFDDLELIPICVPRLGAGYYLHIFFNYNYTLTTAIPILLYCSMAAYLFYRKHSLSSPNANNNLVILENKMHDHVFKALIFNTFWRLLTNVIMNINSWMTINTSYRGLLTDIYFTPLYFTDGIGMFLSYSLFVQKFRFNLKSLIKKNNTVLPITAIEMDVQAVANVH